MGGNCTFSSGGSSESEEVAQAWVTCGTSFRDDPFRTSFFVFGTGEPSGDEEVGGARWPDLDPPSRLGRANSHLADMVFLLFLLFTFSSAAAGASVAAASALAATAG